MDRLTGVNSVITKIGGVPLASIDPFPTPEASRVSALLDTTASSLLARGWWFNSVETTLTFSEGEAEAPAGILGVKTTGFSLEGSTLVSDKLEGPQEFVAVMNTPWEDLPQVFQEYVVSMVASESAAHSRSSAPLQRILQQSQLTDWRQLLVIERRNKGLNNKPQGRAPASRTRW